jgi:uncharacterized protein
MSTLGEKDIDGYAFKVFNQLVIGDKDLDNGVLIILALEESKIRIEFGYGLEDVLTDSKAGMLIDEARSSLSQENFDEGIKYVFENVCDQINKKYNYDQSVIKGNLNNELEYLNYEYEDTFGQDTEDVYISIIVDLMLAGGLLILVGLIYIIDGLFCKGIFFTIVKWTFLICVCFPIDCVLDECLGIYGIFSSSSSEEGGSSGGGASGDF